LLYGQRIRVERCARLNAPDLGKATKGNEKLMAILLPGQKPLRNRGLLYDKKRGDKNGRTITITIFQTPLIGTMAVIVLFLLMMTPPIPVEGTAIRRLHVQLPWAENTMDMVEAPMITIDSNQILVNEVLVDNSTVVRQANKPYVLKDLKNALVHLKEDWLTFHSSSGASFPGVVVLEIDRNVEAIVVISALMTATAAGYRNTSFMVRSWGKPALR
jgi:biopolymer transport protein ExbD